MRITTIKQQLKNPERASIFVDGVYSFSLSIDEIVAYRLKTGIELDQAKIQDFKRISQEGKWRVRSLDWLMRRPHSVKELRDYLLRKKIEPDFAEELIREFSNKGYLDDAAFARFWIKSRRTSKHASSKRIMFELRQKGVAKDIIAQELAAADDDDEQAIQNLIAQKSKLSRYRDPLKLKQYLMRQGFKYDLIKKHLG